MHPAVRDLYKRFMYVGRDYPTGLPSVRTKVKAAFIANAQLRSEKDILLAVSRGRWWVNELIGVVQLRKYRAMRQRYDAGGPAPTAEVEAAADREIAALQAGGGGASPSASSSPTMKQRASELL
ncbi:MAG: hypothetical protein EOO41_00010 [Methanobacteriota archaeon]|nr:MAG: hypothetical protein EOO41_00010 [Euryarchaeota archaeon]